MYRLIFPILLSGCAITYDHPTKSEAEFNRDLYECKKVAEQRTANSGNAGNIFILADYQRECMTREHGYSVKN